jgi:O-antigen ligase
MGTLPPQASLISVHEEVAAAESLGTRVLSAARLVLLATLLGAPLAFGAVQPWAWGALSVLATALLLLWAWAQVQQDAVRVVWSPLYLPATLFLVIGLVQLFGGLTLDSPGTREALVKLGTNLILFFVAIQLMATAPKSVWGAWGLTVTVFAFSLALFAILQYFSSGDLIYWAVRPRDGGYVFGPYVNHNHYAGLMEMLIPIAAAYVLSQPANSSRRVLLAFALLAPIASLLLSGSRGGLMSLLVEVLILAIVVQKHRLTFAGRRVAVPAALGLMLAALLFLWMDPGNVSRRLQTIADVVHSPEVALGDRLVAGRDSLRVLNTRPWLGTGLGSFATVFPQYRSFPTDFLWDHAHNDYTEALAETGAAGGVLILAALVLFFRQAFGDLGERLTHEAGWLQLGAALGCCGLLVHSFVDFNLHIPANAAWFVVSAAAGVTRVCLFRRVHDGRR